MKTASAGLIELLSTAQEFIMVDTYTFTLIDGTVLVFVSGDPPSGYLLGSENTVDLT